MRRSCYRSSPSILTRCSPVARLFMTGTPDARLGTVSRLSDGNPQLNPASSEWLLKAPHTALRITF
jgi:hypothetical protein